MPSEMSARRADYLAWTSAERPARKPLPEYLKLEPCARVESLAEVRGALKKLKHDSHFMAKIFDHRCKQLYPRDLLVATIPTRKGGRRPVGILRRSQRFDKEKMRSALSIDFVWVLPEFRSCGLGRQLMGAGLVSGKPKDVRLQVAGSEANTAAVGLYSSLGFVWAEDAPDKTEMILSAERAAATTAVITARATPPPPSQQQQQPADAPPHQPRCDACAIGARLEMDTASGTCVVLRLSLESTPAAAARAPAVGAKSLNAQDRAARLSAG